MNHSSRHYLPSFMDFVRFLHLYLKIERNMKKTLLWSLLILVSMTSYSQTDKPVESKITNVTVFLNRAQVTREVKTRIEAGKTNIILNGLTSQLDQQSIQASGKGNFI